MGSHFWVGALPILVYLKWGLGCLLGVRDFDPWAHERSNGDGTSIPLYYIPLVLSSSPSCTQVPILESLALFKHGKTWRIESQLEQTKGSFRCFGRCPLCRLVEVRSQLGRLVCFGLIPHSVQPSLPKHMSSPRLIRKIPVAGCIQSFAFDPGLSLPFPRRGAFCFLFFWFCSALEGGSKKYRTKGCEDGFQNLSF